MPETAAATQHAPGDEGEGPFQFYIPASSSLFERRPRTLKHGDTFAVFDHYGDITGGRRSPEGLYHLDTRHLSQFELLVNGRRPLLLSSNLQDDNAILTSDLTNPDLYHDGRLILEKDTIHLHRAKYLWESGCYERLAVRNFDDKTHRIVLTLRYRADFADLFEVRGNERPRRGSTPRPVLSNDSVTLRYIGLDGLEARTILKFDPPPARLDGGEASYELTLAPKQRCVLFFSIGCGELRAPAGRRKPFFVHLHEAQRTLQRSASRAAAVATANSVLNEVLCRSVADLYMLITDTEHGPYPYAGVPWFSTVFGRDGIITAFEMLWVDPEIARGVLRYLAANQAVVEDPAADAEPGKILHERRFGEMARLGEVPFGRYYGSIDSTPLFVMLAGAYLKRTQDVATLRTIWPNILAALEWIDRYGDIDGDGFVEYARKTDIGLVNQGWKDSHDSIFHADGALAKPPIALCEVQGYVYAAKRAAAEVARALGYAAQSARLEHQAEALRLRFEEAFWLEDLGLYALALDGDKRPCRVRTSNAGHALLAGIASKERALRVAENLMSPDFLSGWGVRTVAAGEARYNPMSYHNGSVWPHDNALLGLGFSRYGLKKPVLRIFSALLDAAFYMDLRRLPELYCGFARRKRRGPTAYPVACAPQAWAGAAPLLLLQACLGLELDAAAKEARFHQPALPEAVGQLTIRNLSLGDASLDLELRRHDDNVLVDVLRRTGDARVVVVT